MKIYRWGIRDAMAEHNGFHYATSKKQARTERKLLRQNGWILDDIEEYNYPLTRLGMLKALNELASHNDNG